MKYNLMNVSQHSYQTEKSVLKRKRAVVLILSEKNYVEKEEENMKRKLQLKRRRMKISYSSML